MLRIAAHAGIMLLAAAPLLAAGGGEKTRELPQPSAPGLLYTPIGITRSFTPIPAYITSADLDLHTTRHRVLIVAGLDGSRLAVQRLAELLARFSRDESFGALRDRIALSAVLCGNPDGLRQGLRLANGSGGEPAGAFPPPPAAYTSQTVPESQYLWRWLAMHAPETVIELVEGPATGKQQAAAGALVEALNRPPRTTCESAMTFGVNAADEQALDGLLATLSRLAELPPKPSRRWLELRELAGRSPLRVAQQLARVYGHALPKIQYIPSLALIGRLRLAAATGDPTQHADVERIVAPYLHTNAPVANTKTSGPELAGYLVFAELYDPARQDDAKSRACLRLVKAAADLGFDSAGQAREALPGHNEMSDGVFMGCPILAAAGRLTGEEKYYQMCARHLRFMQQLLRRSDGLYRHSPLCDAAWGRGNGFPVLGLAWVLSKWPTEQAGRDEVLAAFGKHMDALLPHQDVTGCWHEVIDHPESYREFSCTCMITWAMLRGVRLGLLPRERFEPAIRRGWEAIKLRTQPDGVLVDVCVSTGKQPRLRDYLDRPANWGRDERGGAMALLLATEMLEYEGGRK